MSPLVNAILARCARAAGFLLLAVPATTLWADPSRFLFGPATPVAELTGGPGVQTGKPSLTADGLEVFFHRATAPTPNEAATSFELYTARRASTSDPFGTPVRIAELAPPAKYGSNSPSISADGLTLYFSQGLLGGSPEEHAYSKRVFVAARASRDAPFGPPEELTSIKGPGDPGSLSRPEVSADGLSLYTRHLLVTDGLTDADIYVSSRASVSDPWGVAEAVPPFATSSLWEDGPGATSDGLGVFSARSWVDSPNDLPDVRGFGDIYYLQRTSPNSWSAPVNLGDAINTANDELDTVLTADGSTLYFSRATTTWNIYQAPVLPFNAMPLSGQGGVYQQNFDSLGDTSKTAGQAFPDGWTFTANDVIFNNATTRKFPISNAKYAGAFNAGISGEFDRALATGVTDLETGELQLRAHVEGGPVQALRLAVDVEAWQVAKTLAATPGEAAFNVILEADTGKGFEKLADLGRATTGEKLVFPDVGSGLNGNDPANRGSFDSGPVSVSIPEGATLRLRFVPPSETDVVGWTFGLDNLSLHTAAPGDANVDGKVDLADFGTLKANFGKAGHFTDGDFSGNGQVDLSDFGLLKENFGKSAPATVPEPNSLTLAACGAIALLVLRRRSTAPCRLPVHRRGNQA